MRRLAGQLLETETELMWPLSRDAATIDGDEATTAGVDDVRVTSSR